MNGLSRAQARHGRLHPTGSHGPEGGAGRRFVPFLIAGALVGLAACAETGDFGRPKPGVWGDVVLPAAGSWAARQRGEPVSSFPLTDLEDELRDRSWRFLMPAHERAWFDLAVAGLVRTRVLPPEHHPADRASYSRALMGESFASPASRFRRIGEDAEADRRLIGPFASVAWKVIQTDRARLRGLAHVRDLTDAEIAEATARVAENRCLIAWVRAETAERIASYRSALEHAFIAMPQHQAIEAERAVRALDVHRRTLDTLPVPAWSQGTCVELPEPERRLRASPVAKG